MRRVLVLLTVPVVVMAAATIWASPAAADEFDWGDNMACAVLSVEDTQCFETEAEMEEATNGGGGEGLLSTYCNGDSTVWLYLYEHTSFGGRVLKFRDADIWQDLSPWSFNDMTSSYKNDTACSAYLAENAGGGGSSITASASSSATSMPAGWNDRVSSFFIDA